MEIGRNSFSGRGVGALALVVACRIISLMKLFLSLLYYRRADETLNSILSFLT